MTKPRTFGFFNTSTLSALCLFGSLFFFSPGSLVELRAEPAQPTASIEENKQSVLSTIDLERANIDRLKEQLSAKQALWDSLKGEINAYRLQLSAHGNLLLSPGTEIEPLEKAADENKTALEQIQKRIKDLAEQIGTVSQMAAKNEEQLRFNEQQLSKIKTQKQNERETKTLIKNLETLLKTLSDKQKSIEALLTQFGKGKETFDEISTAMTGLSSSFEEQIEKKKKEKIFQRGATPLKVTEYGRILEESKQISQKIGEITSAQFWQSELKSIWESEGFRLFSFFVLLVLTGLFFARIKRVTRKLAALSFYRQYPWRKLTFRVFSQSLPLLGVLLFFYIFTRAWHINELSIFFLIQKLLWVLLPVRWCLDSIRLLQQSDHPSIRLRLPTAGRLPVISAGVFAALYIVIDWMIDGVSTTLLLLRAIFEFGFLIWGLNLMRRMNRQRRDPDSPVSLLSNPAYFLIIFSGYIILGTGPVLEMIGFGEFALYWYLSWARTGIVLLWATLFFMVLREWDSDTAQIEEESFHGHPSQGGPVRWIVIRICRLVWACLLAFLLFVAWGARQPVIDGLLQLLRYPIRVGEMQLSLMGMLQAFLALFFTHLIVKACRYLLKEKLLIKSGVDRGLQESINNLTAYCLWGLGILIALHAVGFNTASLAVVLGALGIGLGFGLQNIFNNFVSGIILLFERPIQPGDDVEINGIWASVKKINVRSTIVQTYDNASLIIPNSELISNQVTNWSFKDRRLRRKIQVGVAYGTDTELVRNTLLEIADASPDVLRHPEPDVLFSDFADSALIFTLRIWTTISHMVKVESDIRYEIDRLFKERNISIAFPQRDVHVYHMNPPPEYPEDKKKELLD